MIKAKQIKPSANACNHCLNKRNDGSQLFEIIIINYGCEFKLVLCESCLKDVNSVVKKSYGKKGKEFTTE